MKKKRLALKRQKFVDAYIKEANGTKAAKSAGYSPRTAHAQATRLLKDADIRLAILEGRDQTRKIAKVDAAWVLTELAELAKVDIADLFDEHGDVRPIEDMPEAARRLIGGFEVEERWEKAGDGPPVKVVKRKVKLLDRLRVLEMLGKHKIIDAWRISDVNVTMPVLEVRNYTGRDLPGLPAMPEGENEIDLPQLKRLVEKLESDQ